MPGGGAGWALCSSATRRLRKRVILRRARLLCCERTRSQCSLSCFFRPCSKASDYQEGSRCLHGMLLCCRQACLLHSHCSTCSQIVPH